MITFETFSLCSIKMTADANGNVALCIDHVNPTDGGAYKMVASNPSGQESALCAVAIMREYIFLTILRVNLFINLFSFSNCQGSQVLG